MKSLALVIQLTEGIANSIISKRHLEHIQGLDDDAVKYVKKVKALIDKRLDQVELGQLERKLGQLERKLSFHANWIFQYFTN